MTFSVDLLRKVHDLGKLSFMNGQIELSTFRIVDVDFGLGQRYEGTYQIQGHPLSCLKLISLVLSGLVWAHKWALVSFDRLIDSAPGSRHLRQFSLASAGQHRVVYFSTPCLVESLVMLSFHLESKRTRPITGTLLPLLFFILLIFNVPLSALKLRLHLVVLQLSPYLIGLFHRRVPISILNRPYLLTIMIQLALKVQIHVVEIHFPVFVLHGLIVIRRV